VNELGIIGDIHGCLTQLQDVVSKAESRVNELVFLGDYVNRGPDSSGVINYLLALQARPELTVHFLRGNHDAQLLDALTGDGLDMLLRMGGAATIRSYVAPPYAEVSSQLRNAVPASHLEFLTSLRDTFSQDGVTVAHDPAKVGPIDTYLVAGHSVQQSAVPMIGESRAYIDTGCGTIADGRLTCLFWPSRGWIQSESSCL
jgi:serine/threonine protein phosphatase 1